ncbi:MAG: RDD family protein [Actinomycetota bacterium]|nr:RDD family protein [Actinomycetota bacterium]
MGAAAEAAEQDRTDVMGRRIGAALIDILLLGAVFVVIAVLVGDTSSTGGNAQARLGGGGTALFAAISLLYYFLSELDDGRTLGKRALGIRVVSDDGSRASAGQIAGRTLLRIVDSLPLLYLVGLVVALVTPKRQRIGDLAAGTRVTRA